MRVVDIGVAAVSVDGERARIHLVDGAGLIGIRTALQKSEGTAGELHVGEHGGGLVVVLVVPDGAVLERHLRTGACIVALNDTVERGIRSRERQINSTMCTRSYIAA